MLAAPRAHLQAYTACDVPLAIITRVTRGTKGWEGCSIVVFFSAVALFNYQMKKRTT